MTKITPGMIETIVYMVVRTKKWSADDAATALGINLYTVRNIVSRARRKNKDRDRLKSKKET